MKKPYLFKFGDPEAYRLIPQEGVKLCVPQGYDGYNCCWDATLSPDGIFYLSLGSENGEGNYAYLNRYNEAENKIEACFYSKDYICPPPYALPGSKLHSCINFLPDGRIICNNHTTDKAPQHPEWLPYSYHSHIWEGFPGSTIFIYDPKTGAVESHGIPAPHETIYGGVYCPKNNAYYMIGFLVGHIYKYDLTTHEVKDLGKAIENCSHRLHLGPDGNIYATAPTGFLLRVKTDTDTLEWTGIQFPYHHSDYSERFTLRYITTYINLDDHRILMTGGYNDQVFVYDITTNTVKEYGEIQGNPELMEGFGNFFYAFNADIDADGVMWYSITPRYLKKPHEFDTVTVPSVAYLYRWDFQNPDAVPENLGVIGVPGITCGLISEVRIDRVRDVLFASCAADKLNGPPIVCIKLSEQRARAGKKEGPMQSDERFMSKPCDPPAPTTGKYLSYEGNSQFNDHEAFDSDDVTIVRLWTALRGDEQNAAVRGLYWDGDTVKGVTGKDEPKYAFTIRNNRLISIVPIDTLPEAERETLIARACPVPEKLPDGVKLPHVTGRQYLAVPSCDVAWKGGKRLIGTKDGKLAMRDGSDVCSYGSMAPCGPVRALCVNSRGDFAYGAAGHDLDISRLFTFDEKTGANELGIMLWRNRGWDNLVGVGEISALALSGDDKQLAIGTVDWISCVYIVKV